MPKIQQSKDKQYRVTIPLEIMKMKGWDKGQSLNFSMQQNGDVILRKL